MGETLTQKIIRNHLTDGKPKTGEHITIRIDQTLTQDLTGILVEQYLNAVDPKSLGTEKTVFYCDHNVIAASSEGADDHLFLKTTAERCGANISKTGNGICHFLHCQRFAAPGKTLLGSDSHTPTAGALGMLAIGSGGLTVAEATLGEGFRMVYPKIMEVRLTGRLRPGVASKDVALEIMRRLTVKGGVGYIQEYTGDGVALLSVSERQTIANMSIETGAFTGIFPSDKQTHVYLKAQHREDAFLPLAADPDATYDALLEINLSQLQPLVALPHMPDRVVEVNATEPIRPNSVFIGSCTNGSFYDIAKAAAILKGHKVHKDIDLTVGPGSRQVLSQLTREGILQDLIDAGARILECSCGPCIGIGQVPPNNGIAVRTSNRNFPGRSGNNQASVYLVSPETAAATAITGHLADPRDFLEGKSLSALGEPADCPVDDSAIITPADIPDTRKVTVIQGPNISSLPTRGPLRSTIDGAISLKVGDNITTDDIVPSNPETIKYNANIPKVAEYTFTYIDSEFPARALSLGKSAIIGGDNYGQGSSRESAALLPMYLGIEVVIAKSYARIHKENLINYGILPLTFQNSEDYEKINLEDSYVIEGTEEHLASGHFQIRFPDKNLVVDAVLDVSESDKELLRLGGALPRLIKKYRV